MKFLPRMAVAVAASALVPVLVSAQQPPQGPPPGGRGGGRGVVAARQAPNRAQLTPDQREQMRTFDEQQRESVETTRRELGDLHRQLNEALTSAQVDTGKVNSLRASIVQKESALAQARVDRLAKLSSILTAEQRQSLGGRGLGEVFGPGGAGGRGFAMGVPPRGEMLRGELQRRGAIARGGAMSRGGAVARGGAMGGGRGMIMQRRPGAMQGQRGPVPALRGRADANELQQLRAEIRRLEAQIEALRRRIR